jgi:hypothetical protein
MLHPPATAAAVRVFPDHHSRYRVRPQPTGDSAMPEPVTARNMRRVYCVMFLTLSGSLDTALRQINAQTCPGLP